MILIKQAHVYAPEDREVQDVLIAGNRIEQISDSISITEIPVDVIDAKGKVLIPGMIDNHVHVCGGGGEGGYHYRTPELDIKDMIYAGVTTVIGVLGTDGTTRTMSNLLAKIYGIEELGLNAYAYTGSYEFPVKTVTGSITDDMILIPKIIGTGELAISDHRSTNPSLDELIRVVSQTRLGGILSGKAGIVNLHMGDAKNPMKLIHELLNRTMIPKSQILPTHMARNDELYKEGIQYAKQGGFIDFTTSRASHEERSAANAIYEAIKQGVPIAQMTMSSDGQGSLPVFDDEGNFCSLTYATCRTMLDTLKEMVYEYHMNLDIVLPCCTSNVANLFGFHKKGKIEVGMDADVVLLDMNLNVDSMISKGEWMLREKEWLVNDPFDQSHC